MPGATRSRRTGSRRIDEQLVLGLGDVIRIGDEEFRFEAAPAGFAPSTSLRLAAIADAGDGTTASVSPPAPADDARHGPLLATLEGIGAGLLRRSVGRR